jgi:hypothetical protein
MVRRGVSVGFQLGDAGLTRSAAAVAALEGHRFSLYDERYASSYSANEVLHLKQLLVRR